MDSKKSQRLISKITDLIGNTPIIETFERGVGYTLASGTSVMASCFAMKGRLGTSVSVHTPGGICKVDLNSYSITAEVFKIFEGEFEL